MCLTNTVKLDPRLVPAGGYGWKIFVVRADGRLYSRVRGKGRDEPLPAGRWLKALHYRKANIYNRSRRISGYAPDWHIFLRRIPKGSMGLYCELRCVKFRGGHTTGIEDMYIYTGRDETCVVAREIRIMPKGFKPPRRKRWRR